MCVILVVIELSSAPHAMLCVACLYQLRKAFLFLKVILYSYLILKKMNERITDR